jgi:bifunctional DNA-binding transcriptional regulator/antitoxin component of YhaV-PrlF toxin-antitoxin module
MSPGTTSTDTTVIETYPVRLRNRGQITVPLALREQLAVADGDFLVLVKLGDLVFLSPKPLQVPRLADRLADMLDESGTTLADLLQSLEEQRSAVWQEQNR